MTAIVLDTLGVIARDAAHAAGRRERCRACGRRESVLADRPDGTVVRHGDVVAKAHAHDTDRAAHRTRLAVAGHPLLTGILLPPLPAGPVHTTQGRPVSAWPYGAPVDPEDPDAAPWGETGALTARLHAVPVAALPGPLPAMRGPVKAALAMRRMRAVGGRLGAGPVEWAWRTLPGWARGEAHAAGPVALCHGDLHLGQLVRYPAPDGPWLLIDVDDLGIGDPAWDLARPAAWFAAGLLAPDAWQRFLDGYRSAHGPAVPRQGDPWPRLDVAARVLTVQSAALAVARSAAEDRDLDEVEKAMIDACARIASLERELDPERAS
jgi:hypothetical protein